MHKKLKDASIGVLGCVVTIAALFLVVFLIRGAVWASYKALPWLNLISEVLLAVCILVLFPMCLFQKSRPWAGIGFYFGSYIFGLTLWAFSCLLCYEIWGYRALIIGLLFAGVGVFPVAVIASTFTGHWSLLRDLLIQLVLTFGARGVGIWLTTRVPAQSEEGAVDY